MRFFLASILLTLELMSFDVEIASQIFNKIFTAIFSKKTIYVYSPNHVYHDVIHQAKNLSLTPEIKKADIVLITNETELVNGHNRLAFTIDVAVLREREEVIGAFYWEYGRPKIVFIQKRLEKAKITLAEPFEKYIVEELP